MDAALVVVHPALEDTAPVSRAMANPPRPRSGPPRIGWLSNNKPNTDALFSRIQSHLQARAVLAFPVFENKGDTTRPAPAAALERLARTCDLVVTGVGD